MTLAIGLIVLFCGFVWLVFFKFRWLKWSIPWAMVSAFFLVHALLIFFIGLRFVTPASTQATVIQHTIQLIPRLSEPTLVTAVLVEPNVPVKKGQPLFQFDRRPYEYNVRQLEAQLAAAVQNVKVLQANVDLAVQKEAHAKADLAFQNYWLGVQKGLAEKNVIPVDQLQLAIEQQKLAQTGYDEAIANTVSARVQAQSEIGGVNTTVAAVEAQLDLAKFYLGNTTMVAPEDGRIVNLQVRPGMVAGDVRLGAIASFICDDGRYLLASYFQESLKYVKDGQPVEVAMNLYPGQIFKAKVKSIWKANGDGQLLPSGSLPKFEPKPPEFPQNQYAVAIVFDDADQSKFPIGAQGEAAIYTSGMTGSWAALRRIGIRTTSWFNFLYPMPF
jgi:multidrug resistance efflux pump